MLTGSEFSVSGAPARTIDTTTLYLFLALILFAIIFYIVVYWRIYTKAGRPGWACLIPIYNSYVTLKISSMSGWWLLAFFVPILNLVAAVMLCLNLAKAFGKGPLFAVLGLIFFPIVGYPILAFGGAQYIGPNEQPPGQAPTSSHEPPQMPTTNLPQSAATPAQPSPQAPVSPESIVQPAPAPQPLIQPQPAPRVDAMTPPAVDAMTPPPPRPGSVVYPPGQQPPTNPPTV